MGGYNGFSYADIADVSGYESGLPRNTIKRVGNLLELNPVEQPLNVTRDRIRGHNQGGVERMDIIARDQSLRTAAQGGDGDLGEPRSFATLVKRWRRT